MSTKVNPLDRFVDTANTGPQNFRVQPLPKLGELISQHGLTMGIQVFDELVEEWRQQHERDLTTQFSIAPTVPAGKVV